MRDKVARIAAVCDRHGAPLRAGGALQFALAHPAVATVIPGAVTPAEVRDNVAMDGLAHRGRPVAGSSSTKGCCDADAPTPER